MAEIRLATDQQDKSRSGRMAGFAAQSMHVEKEKGVGNLGIGVPHDFYNMHVRFAEQRAPLDKHGAVMPQMLYVNEKAVLTIGVFAGVPCGRNKTKSALRSTVTEAANAKTLQVLEASEQTSPTFHCHITPESQPRIVHITTRKQLDDIVQLQVVAFVASSQGLSKKKNIHV